MGRSGNSREYRYRIARSTLTRYPDAEWVPGPQHKQGYQGYPPQNACAGVVLHGMDGYYATGGLNMLMNSGQSWHFSILFDGSVKQHYELEAQCYQSGNASMNRRTIGIEHEGTHSIPPFHALTEAQIQASVKLCKWIAARPVQFNLVHKETLWLHKDLGTSECPATRFDSVLHRWLTPQEPQYSYDIPQFYIDWRGKGAQEWINVWEGRAHTTQENQVIDLIRERRENGIEYFRIEIHDWQEH